MTVFDEINCFQYLFLSQIVELSDNELLVRITEAKVSEKEERAIIGTTDLGKSNRILIDKSSKVYEIHFDSYVAYSVVNESYSVFHEYEERIGRLFCIYSKSNYLDYILKETIVDFIHTCELKHYGINCLNHTINIVSLEEPIIKQI